MIFKRSAGDVERTHLSKHGQVHFRNGAGGIAAIYSHPACPEGPERSFPGGKVDENHRQHEHLAPVISRAASAKLTWSYRITSAPMPVAKAAFSSLPTVTNTRAPVPGQAGRSAQPLPGAHAGTEWPITDLGKGADKIVGGQVLQHQGANLKIHIIW